VLSSLPLEKSTQEISTNGSYSVLVDQSRAYHKSHYVTCYKPFAEKVKTMVLGVKETHKIFHILNEISFNVRSEESADLLNDFVSRIDAKNINKNKYINEVYDRYITARAFDKAAMLGRELGVKIVLPEEFHKNDNHHKVLSIKSLNQINLETFDLEGRDVIIAVVSKHCSLSLRFLHWLEKIEKDEYLKEHLVMFLPQSEKLNQDNNEFFLTNEKNFSSSYIYALDGWPELSYVGTPTIYFFKGGALLRQIVGWPENGRENEFNGALDSLKNKSEMPIWH